EGRATGDPDIVFYNQPRHPSGMAQFSAPKDVKGHKEHAIDFDFSRAPKHLTRIAITLTEDSGADFSKVPGLQATVQTAAGEIQLSPGTFSTEKGIIVAELYLRQGAAKVRAIWQGYASGLAGLCEAYGIEVGDAPAPPPAAPPPPAINLRKVSGSINLSKGDTSVIIEKTECILATVSWTSGTDYDVYALVQTKEGREVHVAAFSAQGVPVLMNYDNGAVRHLGDVGRDDQATKTETIEIRLNDNIAAVVPVVYSAQSNGTGSFHRYQVSMRIDNQQGTDVTIPAKHANNNDQIYTCVPGVIRNTAQGVVIEALELYSKPRSENRPKLILKKDGSIQVKMDAGPKNDYK
ncbi:MAG: TerD family protein, partial [Lamprobacter sp.]|uniref:TerD family protein n=1 Tax=Lamprobacter sp. TaxID=3100796 RepID=UPI002B259157